MIGNVYRGDGFRGLLDYLSGKGGSLLLETNLDGESARGFARQVGEVRQLHPKEHLAQPVCHIPLRPAPGEDLSDEQWSEVLHLTLERMGFASSPYVAYLHDHDDGRHLHIATYRVTFDGALVSDSNDRFRIMAVAREIEREYGLAVARATHPIHLTRPALERLLRDPDRAIALAAIRRAIDQAASRHDTVRSFLTELHRLGVKAEIKVAKKTGALQGIRFAMPDGNWVKGSDLGRDYSLARIANRHELRLGKRSEGRYLAVGEVSAKEHGSLVEEGLEPDQVLRYGSRRTLFWELPKGFEAGFADLLAARLPHRFQHFPDALPRPLEALPDLESRARQVRLLGELVEADSRVAPALDLSAFGLEAAKPHPVEGAVPGAFGECAVRCHELSEALLGGADLPPVSAAALRAEYHRAMAAALENPRFLGAALSEGAKAEPPSDLEPAEPPLTSFSPSGDLEPAQSPVGPPRSAAFEAEPIAAATRYEREASLSSFHRWAEAEQSVRRERRRPGASSTPQDPVVSRAALRALAEDLLAAHQRFAADPTEANRKALSHRQSAYESLARRLEHYRSRREAPRPGRRLPDLERLKADLLATHDRYLSVPDEESEAAWRRARRRYEVAVRQASPAQVPDPSARAEAVMREDAERRLLVSRLREEERRFLAAPHDEAARDRWAEALGSLRDSEDRLAAARRHLLEQLERELRQSASTLAYYEQAHFRSPSPLTERLWRRAERAHLRASLAYERERLALSSRKEPSPRREKAASATSGLARIFEKRLLGQEPQASRLASRALREAWAHTSLGRTALAAAHPLRSLAQVSPASAALAGGLAAGAEALRSALVLYAELRTFRDRFRADAPGRGERDLVHGDLSSRSLAAAVVRHRVSLPAPAPASLPEAIRSARSAEAALLRSYRRFRRGLVAEPALTAAAGHALAARAAVTSRIHLALGLPTYRDFTAVLGAKGGRALTAWAGTLSRAGLSVRAVAGSVAEIAPTVLASTAAAVALVGARRLARWAVAHLRTQALEILREQNEQRR